VKSELVIQYLANRKDLMVGVEATGGANDLAAKLKKAGHEVKLINSNTFKAIGLGGKKTDERDAQAIANILRVNFVPEVFLKSLPMRQVKSLLVAREMLVRSRVNLTNHIRGTLREYGINIAKGVESFDAEIAEALAKDECQFIARHLIFMLEKVQDLRRQEKQVELDLEEQLKEDPRVKLLRTVPGIGNLGSIAFVAVIDEIARFSDGKKLASYLGLVPREHSSGDKRIMGTITRSGSEILRRYLIHGARAVLMHTHEQHPDPMRRWALKIKNRSGMNKAVVALAHRLARIGYAILRDCQGYSVQKSIEAQPKKVA
jgi:transposase